jgi:hypothetical protein
MVKVKSYNRKARDPEEVKRNAKKAIKARWNKYYARKKVYDVGDIVQVMDKTENVYIVPKGKITSVDEDMNGDLVIEIDNDLNYNLEDYKIIILKKKR